MNKNNNKSPLWSLFYEDEGYDINGERIMGRQAAGWSYLKALIKDKPSKLSAYIRKDDQKELFLEKVKSQLDKDDSLDIEFINYAEPHKSAPNGGLFVPGPGIGSFASHRSFFGHDRYSIVGITHTTASNAVMSGLESLAFSDVMPWDAIICTSDCVLDTVQKVLENKYNNQRKKFSIDKPIYPQLPIIPLGVEKEEFEYSKTDKHNARRELNINEDDIVISYVGRLSFHAKAHHYPMYLAIAECSQYLKDGQRIHLIQTGWFANDWVKEAFVEEGKRICPDVIFHFLDGKDQANKHKTLASADIFVSLSDNIQETFGITPIEGMASGLPVLVTDWDGYKSTVRDGVDGFRVKTISLGDGYGVDIAYHHLTGGLSYDQYIGMSVHRVAVDIKDCIEKLKFLITNKDKRIEFGLNGKKRVDDVFDWPNILERYRELNLELNSIREKEANNFKEFCVPRLPGDRLDPFFLFSSYPSDILNNDTMLYRTELSTEIKIKDIYNFNSVNYASSYIPSTDILEKIYKVFNDLGAVKLKKAVKELNLDEKTVFIATIWLLKYGFISIKKD